MENGKYNTTFNDYLKIQEKGERSSRYRMLSNLKSSMPASQNA